MRISVVSSHLMTPNNTQEAQVQNNIDGNTSFVVEKEQIWCCVPPLHEHNKCAIANSSLISPALSDEAKRMIIIWSLSKCHPPNWLCNIEKACRKSGIIECWLESSLSKSKLLRPKSDSSREGTSSSKSAKQRRTLRRTQCQIIVPWPGPPSVKFSNLFRSATTYSITRNIPTRDKRHTSNS